LATGGRMLIERRIRREQHGSWSINERQLAKGHGSIAQPTQKHIAKKVMLPTSGGGSV